MKIRICCLAVLFAAFVLNGAELFRSDLREESELKRFHNVQQELTRITDSGLVMEAGPEFKNAVTVQLKGADVRNRRVTARAEIRVELGEAKRKWGGVRLSFWAKNPPGKPLVWEAPYIGVGQKDWQEYQVSCDFPDWTVYGQLGVGLDGAAGQIEVRSLRIEAGDFTLIPLEVAANRGFADHVANDGKGGWHDQGPDHDAAKFPVKNKTFANVPFKIIDPAKNGGNAVTVFEAPRFADGPKSAVAPLSVPAKGKYLYLLHCSAWGQEAGTPAGSILLTGANGETAELPVIYGRDLVEWWGGKGGENAVPGVFIPAAGGGGAAYVSRFEVPEKLGAIAKVEFRKAPGANALWMLVAATLSDEAYAPPEKRKLVMREDEIWKPLPLDVKPVVEAGTALDFSLLFPRHKVGEFGRVTVGKDGHLEFEKHPGVPVRFNAMNQIRAFGGYFTGAVELTDHASAEALADQIARGGYNMVRFWANDFRNNSWRTLKAGELDERVLELTDYFFARLRERGVYILLSLPQPTFGFDACYPWDGTPRKRGHDFYLNREFSRESWKQSAQKVLTRVNPHTGLRWIDDPQIALIDCSNEEEFTFLRPDNRYAGLFRDFLKTKYGSFVALQTAWGKDAQGMNSFDDIRTFKPLGKDRPGQLNRDRAEFITKEEQGLYEEQRDFLRKLGYRGPVTGFLLGKSMRQAEVRRDFDFVAANSYHAHPSGGVLGKGASSPRESSIGSSANTVRSFLAARLYGKPYVISEQGHAFWNPYRYEHGFVLGSYAALQEFDALTVFTSPVTLNSWRRILDFEVRFDPVRRATELMSALLYRRGDVKPAGFAARVRLDWPETLRQDAVTDSVSSVLLRLGLVAGLSLDQTDRPLQKNEVRLEQTGRSATAVRSADSNVVDAEDKSFAPAKLLGDWKKQGLLPAGNRTDFSRGIYESATGEILLEARENRMTVTTKRFQGLCAEAGGRAAFPNFEVKVMNRRGCLALASIDGDKAIAEAGRLLLFIVTDALNDGMTFENEDRRVRLKVGDVPILVETGRFKVVVKTPNAAAMKVYALGMDGTRKAELPATPVPGGVEIAVDTAELPTFYFEITRQ